VSSKSRDSGAFDDAALSPLAAPALVGDRIRMLRVPEASAIVDFGLPVNLGLSLPCCVQTGGRLCGRGATVASVSVNTDGTWLLRPMCEVCVRAIAAVYEARATST
jgi:hypothetical protein